MTCRIVVLASGTGSLFNALIDARDDELSIEALVTDNPKAGAVDRKSTRLNSSH